jgi:hypothetical protein
MGRILIHRQPDPTGNLPQCHQGFVSLMAAANHQIIGIRDETSVEATLVPQPLPPQHQPPHVEVAEER